VTTAGHGEEERRRSRTAELAGVFLRLGVLGFGGPAAHVAMMRHEFVTTRQWMDDREFLRLAATTNLIPGPNSTELAMHIGSRRAGGRGLLVAGLAFLLPAVAIVTVIAWLYGRHGTDPRAVDLRLGVLPVIIAIIVHAAVGLARSAVTNAVQAAVALAAAAAYLADVHELAVLAGGGAAVCAAGAVGGLRASVPALVVAAAVRVGEARTEPSLRRIAEIFLEVGATLYGSGYVLLAWLDSRFVGPGLIDRVQLLDAIAVGQITPGPVFSTATFVGWQLAGPAGAATATVAIFAPAFVFVALLGRLTAWLDRHRAGRDFLDGLVAASLGMMVAVVVPMAETSLGDPLAVATAIAAMAVLSARLTSATVVVIGGALIGAARLVL